jgi:hypothetical protein
LFKHESVIHSWSFAWRALSQFFTNQAFKTKETCVLAPLTRRKNEMGMSKQMLLLVLLLSVQGATADHDAVAAPAVGQAPPAPPARRRLTLPESVHDKQEVVTVPVSSDLEEEMVCEPSGPCQHCGGQDSESITECMATGRRQAFRCLSPEGGESHRRYALLLLQLLLSLVSPLRR